MVCVVGKNPNPALPLAIDPKISLCLSLSSATCTSLLALHFLPDLIWIPAAATFGSSDSVYCRSSLVFVILNSSTRLLYIYIYIYTYFKIGRSTKRFVFFNLYMLFLLTGYIYICVSHLLLSSENMCGTRPFYGVLNETWTHSCFQYKWLLSVLTSVYRGRCSSFLEFVYFGLLYASLIFDMCIVVCVCVCACVYVLEWFWVSLTAFLCVYIMERYKSLHGPSYFKIYPYSFFGLTTTIFKRTHTHTHIYIYIYMVEWELQLCGQIQYSYIPNSWICLRFW